MAVVSQFEFVGTAVPIRADLPQAFQRCWEHIAKPGPGWSGAERVAIAEECRRAETCALCRERKDAVSPNAIQGEHDHGGGLPAAATEAVHRMSSDPGRLSKSFFEETLAAGLSDVQWAEMVGLVSAIKSVDVFHRAMSLPVEPLPKPASGEATGYRPEGATISGGWLPMIREKDLAENEKDLYGGAPKTGNVLRAMSLAPDEVRNLDVLSAAMYIDRNDIGSFSASGNRALDRMQLELLGARVSKLNECFY